MEQLKIKTAKYYSILVLFIVTVLFTSSCKSQEGLEFSDLKTALKNKNEVVILKIRNENKYKSIPLEIYDLPNLEILSFTGSDCDMRNKDCINIDKIPAGIENLSKLKELYLVMNNIKSLTDEINDLNNLKVLDLSNNASINIDNLSNESIETLNLNECYLSSLPKFLYKMKNLKTLGLEGNNIGKSEIEELQKKLPKCKIYW
jgi:Leucine-rich repeat (LRR) protein